MSELRELAEAATPGPWGVAGETVREVIAEASFLEATAGTDGPWSELDEPAQSMFLDWADATCAALSEKGYTICGEQVGEWCDLHGLCESRNAEGPGGRTPFDFPDGTPVHIALIRSAVEDTGEEK